MTNEYLIDREADVSLEKINLLTWKMVLMEFLDLQSQNPIGGWKDPGPHVGLLCKVPVNAAPAAIKSGGFCMCLFVSFRFIMGRDTCH